MSIQNVFTHGNLVDINVSMWTAERRLQPEDLGLEKEDVSEMFSLGRKKLISPEIIAQFKNKDYLARHILEKFSFPFAFGGARFVPKKMFVEFAQEIDTTIFQFNKLADDFCLNYNRYKLEMRKEYVQIAHAAFSRRKTVSGFDVDEDTFINATLARIEKVYPAPEEIRSKFNMEYVVFRAELPDLSKASYADVAEDQEKLSLMEQAYTKTLTKKVNEFVDKVIGELRSKAVEVIDYLAESIKSGKAINEASLNTIRNMIEDYEKKDIIGDVKFLGMLKEFKLKLDKFTAKQIKADHGLQKSILDELKALSSIATDETAIAALANGYRDQIKL